MNDDRIARYLHDQAEGIALTPADPSGAMRRGNRRRTRRRTGLVGAVAVVGLLATSVALRDGGHDQELQSAGSPDATASTFDWSVVTPKVGLGYGDPAVQLADGSVYSISTAPGPYREGEVAPSTLYRSSDGTEWSAATLPSAARSSDLAAAGDTLYSVGTSPAGGLVLSSSTDQAASWGSLELPDDVAQLQARHPGKITLGPARVAALDGTHVVATEMAATSTDLGLYRPEYASADYSAEWGPDGVTVRENPRTTCESALVETPDPAAAKSAGIDCRGQAKDQVGDQVASYTYDELGITGELREHLGGKIYAFATSDGHTFQRVDVPVSGGDGTSANWYVSTPIATPQGFALVTTHGDKDGATTEVFRSTDGTSWSAAGTLDGSTGAVGLLGDRLAVSVWGNEGGSTLRVQQPDGAWSTLDIARAVDDAGSKASLDDVTFGPLGVAGLVTVGHGDTYDQYLVHTSDGSALQVEPVADLIDNGGQVAGIVVTADAIVARVTDPNHGDPSHVPSQHVLVGTPRG